MGKNNTTFEVIAKHVFHWILPQTKQQFLISTLTVDQSNSMGDKGCNNLGDVIITTMGKQFTNGAVNITGIWKI